MIDQAIKTYKPDIYIGVEDIWALMVIGINLGGIKSIT